MTFENKKFSTANDIRLVGRPRKRQIQTEVQTAEQQELFKSDLRKRSVIEGRIGTGKEYMGWIGSLPSWVKHQEQQSPWRSL
ncbi:MAG: hypothetical protein EB116_13325 [Betaproteobacteria bacterium]|nr:hypothetical protein [Betaproteobacteria bacterium]